MKKIIKAIIITSAAAAAVLTGAFFLKKQPVYNSSEEVQLCSVRRTDLDKSIYIMGKVVSDESETLYSRIDAPVGEILVSIGDMVRAGDVICTFDCTELQKEYDRCEAALKQLEKNDDANADHFELNASIQEDLNRLRMEQAQKKLENYQAQYDEASARAEEYRVRYEDAAEEEQYLGSVLEGGSDDTENIGKLYVLASRKKTDAERRYRELLNNAESLSDPVEDCRKELEALVIMQREGSEGRDKYFTPEQSRKMIESYKAQLSAIGDMLAHSTVTATRDGIITDLYISRNNYVPDHKLCCIQDPDKVHFSGYLLPENSSEITENSRLVVSMPDRGYMDIDGEILFVSDRYDEQNRGYEIDFTIDDIESYTLYPGNEITARIVLESQGNTLVVPYDAVFETDGQQYVRRYDGTGAYEDIPVTVGLTTGYYVAVGSPELSENDLVATDMIR